MAALRRAATSLATRLQQPLRDPASALAATRVQAPPCAQQAAQLQQARPYISVDVPNNQVDRAWRTLQRRLRDEGYMDAAQRATVYLKPSERRKLEASASQKKRRKQNFQQLLSWVMRRKTRGA